ncbi:MAG: SMP-30/gluconolactonase/LRE family protein [Rhizobiaceae bacterium]|nr:MAG: SMP-30/gluconolactonase/LRE family protein [Rhizobiaceae bacterium]CAG1011561.1 L-arabinonolactonase [Rhizobiaceae bacterium]
MTATIFSDISCHLGEGPTYDAFEGTLYWLDIIGRRLLRQSGPGEAPTVEDLPEMASAIAAVDGERQLLVTETGLHLRDRRTGRLTSHLAIEADDPSTRSNDSRTHPSGAFWIGTMGKKAERKAGSIYWYRAGELRKLYPGITIPNSICFSPGGDAAYYTDTAEGILWRVDCDPATGLPRGEPRIFVDRRGLRGGIDGTVTDVDGVLWNAVWGIGRLDAYAPDGRLLRSIDLPAKQTTCPAFLGAAADRIVVTSAREGLDAGGLAADPQAGKTFLIDIAVTGRHDPAVLL